MSITRRRFISTAASIGALSYMDQLEIISAQTPLPAMTAKTPVKILATNWGFDGSWDAFCAKAKASGYDGFEAWIPMQAAAREELLNAAQKHGLEYGFLAGGSSADFAQHFESYEAQVRMAVAHKPLYVNTHAGRDFFSFEQNKKILETGVRIGKESGIDVLCETHRGRCAYSAPVSKEYMDKIPDLRFTADLSHWCVVHESLLEGFEPLVTQTLERTGHIHARVGHAEGPQVNDPRAPEWESAVKRHLGWWDAVMERAARNGKPFQTFLTEFGPPHYLPALPYTQQPVADQWAVNVHMMQMLRKRYA